MAYEKVKALIGKRVRVARGTPKDIRKPDGETEPAGMLWCAGGIPVGSTGTIIDLPDSVCLCQIKWDSGRTPCGDYAFGISKIGYGLEEIPLPKKVRTEDGYVFYLREDGSYADADSLYDADMAYKNLGELAEEADFTIVTTEEGS